MTWAIDLDGVLWRGSTALDGAAGAVNRLQAAGHEVVFITNNASVDPTAVEDRLHRQGVTDVAGRVVTSAMIAAGTLSPGERVMVLGSAPLMAAVAGAGCEVVLPPEPTWSPDDEPPEPATLSSGVDAVVCGWTRQLTWSHLAAAHVAICDGARFIATNTDVRFPAGTGTLPGNGAAVAALTASTGRRPVVTGKPHAPAVAWLRSQGTGVVVGDQPATDGALARAAGWTFALVTSGVTAPDEVGTADPVPDVVGADLADVVGQVLAQRPQGSS